MTDGLTRIKRAIASLAIARQASDFGEDAQRVYLHLLGDIDPSLFARVCEHWARTPRADFAPTMPPAADLRETATAFAAHDAQTARLLALAPMPDDDRTGYFCESCRDESSAWQPFWCAGHGAWRVNTRPARADGPIVECGRTRAHGPHAYVTRCACSDTNPVIADHRRRIAASRIKQDVRHGR